MVKCDGGGWGKYISELVWFFHSNLLFIFYHPPPFFKILEKEKKILLPKPNEVISLWGSTAYLTLSNNNNTKAIYFQKACCYLIYYNIKVRFISMFMPHSLCYSWIEDKCCNLSYTTFGRYYPCQTQIRVSLRRLSYPLSILYIFSKNYIYIYKKKHY